ncbi:MAG: hypothetical protein EZS28_052049, partial [Streblomastix strix]
MQPNIPRAQTEWRMEENLRLQNVEYGAYSQTFKDNRYKGYDFNAEERGLEVHDGHNISLQPHKSQRAASITSSVKDIRNQINVSANAILFQHNAIHICENNITNNIESQRDRCEMQTQNQADGKSYMDHPHHRANLERKKWIMIVMSWDEAYK